MSIPILALMLNKGLFCLYSNEFLLNNKGKWHGAAEMYPGSNPGFPLFFTNKQNKMKHSAKEKQRRKEMLIGMVIGLILIGIIQSF